MVSDIFCLKFFVQHILILLFPNISRILPPSLPTQLYILSLSQIQKKKKKITCTCIHILTQQQYEMGVW